MSAKTRILVHAVTVLLGVVLNGPMRASGQDIIHPTMQLLSVIVPDEHARQFLFDLEEALPGTEIWSDDRGAPTLDVRASEAGRDAIRRFGLHYEVKIDDLDCLYDDYFNRPLAEDFFDDFATYEEHAAFLAGLAARFPELATLVDLGPSVEGRPMWMLRIAGRRADQPAVFYHGAQHGNEIISPAVLAYFARYLLENYESDSVVRSAVDGAEWFIVPISNPDGYVRRSRYNAHGKDLNRDWGGPGASDTPFSQAETAHLRDLILQNRNVAIHADLHSAGFMIMWAWGHTPTLCFDHWTNKSLGATLGDIIKQYRGSQYNHQGSIYNTIYPVYGGSVDYCYAEHKITSMTFEIGGDQIPKPEEILPTCREFAPALLYFGTRVVDCNANGIADWDEIHLLGASDCNGNFWLDGCESPLDCDGGGVQDFCELWEGKAEDCNGDALPDACQIGHLGFRDWDRDGVMDRCEECPGDRIGAPSWDERRISRFGAQVALHGETAVVAAPATDDLGNLQGAAFVMRVPSADVLQVLTNEPRRENDLFAQTLAADEDHIAVSNEYRPRRADIEGTVHVFGFDGRQWFREAVLHPEGGTPEDHFGYAIALRSNLILVGADDDAVNGERSGAAHVFRRTDGEWRHEQTLRPSDPRVDASFGTSVALSDTFAVVGAPQSGDGAVYVYENSGSSWVQRAKLTNRDIMQFGRTLAADGSRIAVGGLSDQVQVLRYTVQGWRETAILKPMNQGGRGDFGWSLHMAGDLIAVGAPTESFFDVSTGAAYVFRLEEDGASIAAKLPAPGARHEDRFGHAVCLDDRRVFVGARDGIAGPNKGYVSLLDLATPPCSGGEKVEAKCKVLREGKRYRPQVRVYAGQPMRAVTLRLDDDPATDRTLLLNCQGGGRLVFPRSPEPAESVQIVECAITVEVQCAP